jgi:hypothetical protein
MQASSTLCCPPVWLETVNLLGNAAGYPGLVAERLEGVIMQDLQITL